MFLPKARRGFQNISLFLFQENLERFTSCSKATAVTPPSLHVQTDDPKPGFFRHWGCKEVGLPFPPPSSTVSDSQNCLFLVQLSFLRFKLLRFSLGACRFFGCNQCSDKRAAADYSPLAWALGCFLWFLRQDLRNLG